jgi:predicted Fe-Mo cluster-binding NifX family protein
MEAESVSAEAGAPSADVVVCLPVAPGRRVGHSWGKAPLVALATVRDGAVVAWAEYEVRWDVSHASGHEGSHHARVVRFLREHGVGAVAAHHMGQPMVHTLGKLGVVVVLGAADDGEAAALAAASRVVPSA